MSGSAAAGANAALLLNLPPRPDGLLAPPDGLLAPPDAASLRGLGQLLQTRLGRDLATGAAFSAGSAAPGHPAEAARAGQKGFWQAFAGCGTAEVALRFAAPTPARYLSLREELTVGQRIEAGEV